MTPEQAARQVEEALSLRGVSNQAVVVVDPADQRAPLPPPGRWVIATYGSTFVVGAVGRGQFRAYEQFFAIADAVDVAVRLLAPPVREAVSLAGPVALERGRATADGIRRRVAEAGAVGAAGVAVGDVLDLVGPQTEHHLFAYGTPFPQRAQPPTDLQWGWSGYAVVEPLPGDCREGVAAPWFGQPGGGPMVVLSRPVRWYLDEGILASVLVEGNA